MERVTLNAQIIFKTLARLARLYMVNPPGKCSKLLQPDDLIISIYRYRSNLVSEESILREISCSLALKANGLDASRISLSTLKASTYIGFHNMIRAVNSYYKMPSPIRLKEAVLSIGSQLGRTCLPLPGLDEEMKSLERKMKLYGALMGATLPILFILSMFSNLLLGVVVILLATALWYLIRRSGEKYRYLSVEKAWSECLISEEDLRGLLKGRAPIPSIFEILGVPPPRLD